MLAQLATMAVAQFFDFGTFFVMVQRHGPAAEANPVVVGVLSDAGLPAVALVKVALVVLVAAASLLLATVRGASQIRWLCRRLATLLPAAAILAGLLGGWSNALAIGSL